MMQTQLMETEPPKETKLGETGVSLRSKYQNKRTVAREVEVSRWKNKEKRSKEEWAA